MSDHQDRERHETYAARAHQLQARLEKCEASNARLTRVVGQLSADKLALEEELQALREETRAKNGGT